MSTRFGILFLFSTVIGLCGDWNPRLAAQYLDSRQKAWFEWKAANGQGTPCVSCHTGVPYLLVRPMLRQTLGEGAATPYETGLLDAMRSRTSKKTVQELSPNQKEPHASEAAAVEAIFAAVFLAKEDVPRGKWSPETAAAFDRMWALQIQSGKERGAWLWNEFNLDPWETPESSFYGASLAALATGLAGPAYQAKPEVKENIAAMTEYLKGALPKQPLHNRLTLLWAADKFPAVLSKADKKAIIDETLKKQQADGGWTLESLGGWATHSAAPESSGSNGYATALVAFTLKQAGVPKSSPGLARTLDWLKAHQDKEQGYWDAVSMNKKYAPETMPAQFMRDAATGFATLALLDAK